MLAPAASQLVFNAAEVLQPQNAAMSSNNKKQQFLKVDKTKYKTEMCKNWIEIGVCRYGNKCQFAHGDFELLGKQAP